MSSSDRDEAVAAPVATTPRTPQARTPGRPDTDASAGDGAAGGRAGRGPADADDAPARDAGFEGAEDEIGADTDDADYTLPEGLTPRQARALRVAIASVLLAVMAVLLWIRLSEHTSFLVMGVYGIAMVMFGVVIEMSRAGRTRLATWVMAVVLVGALGADWLLP